MTVPSTIESRRTRTDQKAKLLIKELSVRGADEIVGDYACVYATGSLGRGELSDRSDLDLFVLRDRTQTPHLTNLEEIRLKARLIEVAREQNYPEFSGDGKYIQAHDLRADVIAKLGTSEDDYVNVFTARMLLILESRALLGRTFYEKAVTDVIAEYWRDYEQNSTQFLPVFLVNDILRFWKTLCLNYEDRTNTARTENVGKRHLHNYKLKHSRLLTCYSAIVCLQAILQRDKGTVSPEAVIQMVSWTPTERLEQVAAMIPASEATVQSILDQYGEFLDTCDEDKTVLIQNFGEPVYKRERFKEAMDFGNSFFDLVTLLGKGTPLLRYLVI